MLTLREFRALLNVVGVPATYSRTEVPPRTEWIIGGTPSRPSAPDVVIAGSPGNHASEFVVPMTAKVNPTTAQIKVIHQPVNAKDEAIVNAYGIQGSTIQFAQADMPVGFTPSKFDTMTINGKEHVLSAVVAHNERGSGTLVYWIGYSKS